MIFQTGATHNTDRVQVFKKLKLTERKIMLSSDPKKNYFHFPKWFVGLVVCIVYYVS